MAGTKKEFDPLSGVFADPASPSDAPPSPSGTDPRALARILAKAAAAKAGAPRPAPSAAAPAAPPSAAAAPARPAGLAGAPPPKRALSAAEALEAARRAEEERVADQKRKEEEARRLAAEALAKLQAAKAAPAQVRVPAEARPDRVTPHAHAAPSPMELAAGILHARLPGGGFTVSHATLADDRKLLGVLWKAHRTRFITTHQVDQAIAADIVLQAVLSLGPGELVAATVTTDRGDWLVWIDATRSTVLATFANARAWLAGLEAAAS